jgi:hypothetical protein
LIFKKECTDLLFEKLKLFLFNENYFERFLSMQILNYFINYSAKIRFLISENINEIISQTISFYKFVIKKKKSELKTKKEKEIYEKNEKFSVILKKNSINFIENWSENFSNKYPKLKNGLNFIKNSLKEKCLGEKKKERRI